MKPSPLNKRRAGRPRRRAEARPSGGHAQGGNAPSFCPPKSVRDEVRIDFDLTAILAANTQHLSVTGLKFMVRQWTGRDDVTEEAVLAQLRSLAARALVKQDADGRWFLA